MIKELLTTKKLRFNSSWLSKATSRILMVSFFLSLLISTNLFAQEKTITGTITGAADNAPLPGVNVIIKGTSIGTVTDLDGHFEISARPEDVLIISFIGFLPEETVVGEQTNIDFKLIEDIAELDEVVVIGYGTQKKKLVTGATEQVKGEDLEKRNTTNPLQALQGQSAGVNITSTSGQPGEGLKVSIRGVGTTGNSSPLYIVDGIPTGDIDFLNASDIESIDVLKDAASAAIYGARGANGVILITTKKGTKGKGQITFDAYYGVQNLGDKIEMLDAQEYASIINEQHLNSGGSLSSIPFNTNNLPAYTTEGVANTNWLDEMFVDNAKTQNYVLGASGGSENSFYSLSVSYTGQEGIVGGEDYSNYERYVARFNSENSLYNDRIKIGQSITYSHIENNGISVGNQYSNTLRSAFNVSPILPMYDEDGEYFNTANEALTDQNGDPYWLNEEGNPYANMVYNNQNDRNRQKILASLYADFQLAPNLTFKTLFGLDYYSYDDRSFKPIYELSIYSKWPYTQVTQKMEKSSKILFDNILTYNIEIGQSNFLAMGGVSLENYGGVWLEGKNADLAFTDLEHAYLDNATNTSDPARMSIQGAPKDRDKRLSYFGRVQYDFKETYMFNATFRADGSSKFASENRWGNFPSVSAGWVLSNEDFMSTTGTYLNFLKLRASWGQNGNSNIDAFQYLAPIKFDDGEYNFSDDENDPTVGSYPSRLSNIGLIWETSEQINIGIDSRFFNSLLIANVDIYQKTTKDWLIRAPILATAGTAAPFINGGNVINKGIELSLTHNNNLGDFSYQINANASLNKNEVVEIPTKDGIIHGSTNSLYANSEEFYRAEEGYPIGYFWGWETDGLFQKPGDVTSYTNSQGIVTQPNAKPGDLKYVDQNDDGVINDDDKVNLGDPNPDLIYGFNLSCEYKIFDLGIVTNGVMGNQLVQSYRDQTNKFANYTTDILDRWTEPGSSTTIPRVTNKNINYKFSDIFVKSGNYLRISNITVGCDLTNLIKVNAISQFRVYASAQNLYTFTSYSGMDPEVGFGLDNGATDKFSSGIDLGYYPRPRTMLVGVNIKF